MYILQPVLVCGNIFRWVELQFAAKHRRQSDVGHVLHREEPLLAEAWLNGSVLIAL